MTKRKGAMAELMVMQCIKSEYSVPTHVESSKLVHFDFALFISYNFYLLIITAIGIGIRTPQQSTQLQKGVGEMLQRFEVV